MSRIVPNDIIPTDPLRDKATPMTDAIAVKHTGDLLPCPFCNGSADYVGSESIGYRVECRHCGAQSGWGDYGYQVEAAWNRRSSTLAADRVVDDAMSEAAYLAFRMKNPWGSWAEVPEMVKNGYRKMLTAALRAVQPSIAGEAVGLDTPAEWELEQRAFHAANNPTLSYETKVLIQDLWRQYCLAAAPALSKNNGDGK